MKSLALLILTAILAGAAPQAARAQASTPPAAAGAPGPTPMIDNLPQGPPLGSLSLSQIVLKIEGEPEFAYVSAVAWRDGKYAITFVTRDGESHEKSVDPRTGRDTGGTGRGKTPGGSTPSDAPSTAPRPSGPVQ